MLMRVRELVTTKSTFYVAYNPSIDQFVSKAFPSVAKLSASMGVGVLNNHTRVDEYKYDMREETIGLAITYISKLKLGKELNVEEMLKLANFFDFLRATVAPHQRKNRFSEISEAVIRVWIREFGLDKRFPHESTDEILTEHALYSAFLIAQHRRESASTEGRSLGRRARPRSGENKLAGRYVSALVRIAKVTGDGRMSPVEIVNRFYCMMKEEVAGG